MGLHWTFGRGRGHGEMKGTILRSSLLSGSDHSAGGSHARTGNTQKPRSAYSPVFLGWGLSRHCWPEIISNHYISKAHFFVLKGKIQIWIKHSMPLLLSARRKPGFCCCCCWSCIVIMQVFINRASNLCFMCTKAISHSRCSLFGLNLCNSGWGKSHYLHTFINTRNLKFN